MLLPISWLHELLPHLSERLSEHYPQLSPHDALEHVMAKLGLPLESIETISGIPAGVVYGEVMHAQAIPETHLQVLKVNIGQAEPIQVVCGASNAQAGIGIALATPGTVLPGDISIGVRDVQGVSSWGMVCSPKELGIGEYAGGILALPLGTAATGSALSELWAADVVIDVEITPNRADVLSALGVARELAAYFDIHLHAPSSGLLPERLDAGEVSLAIGEQIVARGDRLATPRVACDHFVARTASGVRNLASPLWLQRRLLLCGLRPIHLIVDSSNYVMLELGQPTAFYDRRDLAHTNLRVCAANEGQTVRDLLGKEHSLTAQDAVILSPNGIVGIAGIIGAEYASVRSDTSDVVLESAHFDPVLLRRTASGLGVKTDAVYRYERGVDPELPLWAANRIMELLATYGQAQVHPVASQQYQVPARKSVVLHPSYVCSLLGLELDHLEMQSILQRLGCQVEIQSDVLSILPPSWRVDLNIPEDFIEEIARLHGYDQLEERLPSLQEAPDNANAGAASAERQQIQRSLAQLGFSEVVTYTFTNDEEASLARAAVPNVRLRNPLTAERTGLRTALYPSLLNAARTNNHEKSLLIFELGHIFPASGESERLGVLMRGDLAASNWQAGLAGGFYTFKGLLEAFAHNLGSTLQVTSTTTDTLPAHLHPGIAGIVHWNGEAVGHMGQIHPAVAQAWGFKDKVYILEMALPLPKRRWSFRDPSRQPAALRDMAIIAPKQVSYAEIAEVLRKNGGTLLESLDVFDVYSGHPIPEGARSVAVRLTFRGQTTLQDSDIEPVFEAQIAAIKAAGWGIREA